MTSADRLSIPIKSQRIAADLNILERPPLKEKQYSDQTVPTKFKVRRLTHGLTLFCEQIH